MLSPNTPVRRPVQGPKEDPQRHPQTEQQPFNWRAHLPVHPAAELFPLMSEYDPIALKELAENIKANGLVDPIVIWADDNGDNFLLDGRNRLDAMTLAGILGIDDLGILFDVKTGFPVYPVELLSQKPAVKGGDPYAIALSLNVHRRHLTNEQKRDLIAKVLKAKSETSNRQVAKMAGVSHVTVGAVRGELESTGQIDQLEKTVGADGKARPVKAKKKAPSITVPASIEISTPIIAATMPIEPVTDKHVAENPEVSATAPDSPEDIGAYLERLGPDRFFAALQYAPTIKAEIERRVKPKPSVGETNVERIGKLVDEIRALFTHPDQHKDEIKAKLASIKRTATKGSGTKIPEQKKPTLDNETIARADVALKAMGLKTGGNDIATEASAEAAYAVGNGEAPVAGSDYSIPDDLSIPHWMQRGAA